MHARLAAFECWQMLPYFVGGEAEDRRDKPRQRLGDTPQRGLRAAASGRVGRQRVEAVLNYVEIERAEVSVGELIQRLVRAMKFELVVCRADSGVEFRGARENVLVERLQLAEVQCVLRRREIAEVREQKTQRVAQLAIVVADPLHQVLARSDVLAKVNARDPQAHDLAAETLRD